MTPAPTSLTAGPITRFDGLAADAPPRSIAAKIPVLFNPFLRLVLFIALMAALSLLAGTVAVVLFGARAMSTISGAATVQLLASVLAYGIWTLLIERRRPPFELAPRRALGLLWGMLFGAVAISVVFGLIWLVGGFQVLGRGHPDPVGWWLSVYQLGAVAGISEEILFRGVLYRILEELLGSWVAIIGSAVVFGAVHLSNPDGTVWGAVAIGLEAGLLFGVLYAWSRSLWLTIGFHAAWNVFQGSIYGISVSGTGAADGLLRVTAQGNPWISGGRFGAEASIIAVLLLTAVAIVLAVRLARHGGVVSPMWTRRARRRRAIAAGQPDALPG